jgi:outer membrane PBP1 activator LpoA protein
MQISSPAAVRKIPAILKNAIIALLLATLITGCSSGIRSDGPGGGSRLQRQALALEDNGDYQGAAALYLQAAAKASGRQALSFRLQAAGSLIRGADYLRATRLLDELPEAELDGELQQHYAVNRAAIALGGQHPDQALEILADVPSDGPFVADYRRLRAEAYLQNGRFFPSAQERVKLDSLLTDPESKLGNDFAIWEALNNLTDAELQQLRTAPPPDVLSGWMELVELSRLYLQQPDALAEVVPHWQRRYRGHPASVAFIDELLGTLRNAGQTPASIALLLPLNGSFHDAASAVRDGVLAAYYATPESGMRPQLLVYDSGDTPESAVSAYQEATAAGARFVIGPLRKDAVRAIAGQPNLAIPVLALNQIQEQNPTETGTGDGTLNPVEDQSENRAGKQPIPGSALYQFGLAPEDEAREVARTAWREGYSRSIALLPNTEWGERVYAAFASEWQTLGGAVLETRRYDAGQADHGKSISAVLNLDSSKARHLQLSRHLGKKLEFEPRRRQDVDFVFLIASPKQARLIRPQLSFYRASTLPVYSTSRVYTGHPDIAKDADMNGIIFCDMPWTLESGGNWDHLQQAITGYWPANASRYARLYALGIDAYRVVPYLGQLNDSMFDAYHGVTGNLSVDSAGKIHRTLRCAKFRNGRPVLLEPTVRNDPPATEFAIP